MEEHAEEPPDVVASTPDLKLGDHGPEVRRVHDYLKSFGYLPNDALAESRPRWRPLVLQSPSAPDSFDAVLEQAVRGFQGFMNLPVTGAVDAETRKALDAPRCGVPEQWAGDGEKFAISDITWGGFCSPRYTPNGIELTFTILGDTPDHQEAFIDALHAWEAVTSFRFIRGGSNSCIRLLAPRQWTRSEDPSNSTLGLTLTSFKTASKTIDTTSDIRLGIKHQNGTPITWDIDGGANNIMEVLTHEIGHALLLDHSNVSRAYDPVGSGRPERPLMFPIAHLMPNVPPGVTADDMVAAHLRGTTLLAVAQSPAVSMDVGGTLGSFWTVLADQSLQCNGGPIFGAGVQISVSPQDFAWHVNASGQLWKNNTAGCAANWSNVSVPEALKSVAVSANAVFVLGRSGTVFRQNGGAWNNLRNGVQSLTVDDKDQPWIVTTAGQVFSRSAATGSWVRMSSTGATDPTFATVHGGKDGHVWAMSTANNAFVWNSQFGHDGVNNMIIGDPGPIGGARSVSRWQRLFNDRLRNSNVNIRLAEAFTGQGGLIIARNLDNTISIGF